MFEFKIFDFVVFGLFKSTIKLQNRISMMSELLPQSHKYIIFQRTLLLVSLISFVSAYIFGSLYGMNAVLFFMGTTCAFFFLYLIIDTIVNFKRVLVSVRKFIYIGFMCDLIISVIVYAALVHFQWDKIITVQIDALLPTYWHGLFEGGIVSSLLIFGVVWALFSMVANSDVATMANAVIAASFAIILTLSNSVLGFFPQDYSFTFSQTDITLMASLGYSPMQLMQIVVNLLTVPLLIINGIAMLLAQAKGYWVKKYNNGQEISFDEIRK